MMGSGGASMTSKKPKKLTSLTPTPETVEVVETTKYRTIFKSDMDRLLLKIENLNHAIDRLNKFQKGRETGMLQELRVLEWELAIYNSIKLTEFGDTE